ncbi:MAG: lipocalin-like domain-containing protein [Bacteroidaceae bacterium]|nr:lipocalin-like domain-containing protein [Bacteroidaceae bacterium]
MKQYILVFFAVLAFAACDKVPDDRPLDGMWQLQSETRGGQTVNTLDRQVYWSFRYGLVQFSAYGDRLAQRYAHCDHTADSLYIYDLAEKSAQTEAQHNNEWIATEAAASLLNEWGLYPTPDTKRPGRYQVRYGIRVLNSRHMVLTNDDDSLSFRKF